MLPRAVKKKNKKRIRGRGRKSHPGPTFFVWLQSLLSLFLSRLSLDNQETKGKVILPVSESVWRVEERWA